MSKQKYFTEEERKAAQKENHKRYRKSHPEVSKKAMSKWYAKNKEKRLEYDKKRYESKKENILKQKREYAKTQNGRAARMIASYNAEDKLRNRGKGNLTVQWVVENIFSKPCAHCGKTGWKVIGCNRLDNSKPHTIDNVEPCCKECNSKIYGNDTSKQVYQCTLDEELVAIWESVSEAARQTGFNLGHISECCRGKRKKHMNFKWYFKSDYEKLLEGFASQELN